jgi:TIR domain/Interferon-induced transmembrane protein
MSLKVARHKSNFGGKVRSTDSRTPMADIFLSYERSDYARAQKIAQALERYGWSVWWDRNLLGGVHFDKAIEQALETARCVIVLWSKASVSSNWVKDEAHEGARRGILVPVLIDEVQIPIGFRQIHAVRLVDSRDYSLTSEFRELRESVSDLLGRAVSAGTPRSQASDPKRFFRGEIRNVRTYIGWAIAATLVFWPIGCYAVYLSIRAKFALKRADLETAQMYASRARKWGMGTVVAAMCVFVVAAIRSVVNPDHPDHPGHLTRPRHPTEIRD